MGIIFFCLYLFPSFREIKVHNGLVEDKLIDLQFCKWLRPTEASESSFSPLVLI